MVSINGPPNHSFSWDFPKKKHPAILGYPHWWKPPICRGLISGKFKSDIADSQQQKNQLAMLWLVAMKTCYLQIVWPSISCKACLMELYGIIINYWLVVWLPFFIFPYIGNVIIPIDFHIFQRGGPTTNQVLTAYGFPKIGLETGAQGLYNAGSKGGDHCSGKARWIFHFSGMAVLKGFEAMFIRKIRSTQVISAEFGI